MLWNFFVNRCKINQVVFFHTKCHLLPKLSNLWPLGQGLRSLGEAIMAILPLWLEKKFSYLQFPIIFFVDVSKEEGQKCVTNISCSILAMKYMSGFIVYWCHRKWVSIKYTYTPLEIEKKNIWCMDIKVEHFVNVYMATLLKKKEIKIII